MADRQQLRAGTFAGDLGIGPNQAPAVLRELARLLDRMLDPIAGGRQTEKQRLLLDETARGDAATRRSLPLTSNDGRRQLYRKAYRALRDGVRSLPDEPGSRADDLHGFPLPSSSLGTGPW